MNSTNSKTRATGGISLPRWGAALRAAALALPLTPLPATAAPPSRAGLSRVSGIASPHAVSAAAVGRLTPSSCTGTGAAQGDLYALAGMTDLGVGKATGNQNAWSARTGSVLSVLAAGIPPAVDNRGLQATHGRLPERTWASGSRWSPPPPCKVFWRISHSYWGHCSRQWGLG
jgi:hypothetical protein